MTDYHPYTTQFDRTIDAAELPALPILKKFSLWKNEIKYSRVLGRLQLRVAEFIEALPPDVVKELRSKSGDIAVSVLLDHSNSLKSRVNIETSLTAIYTLLYLLDELGITHEILAFTTQSWRGGNSRKTWISKNRPEKPGRLCDLLHIIYKPYDRKEKAYSKLILRNILRPDLLKENVDGEALDWAASRLAMRKEINKILFHVSDGAPVDDSTIDANSADYLFEHLKAVIKGLEEEGKIKLYGLGLDFRVSEYFSHSLHIDSAAEAVPAICNYTIGRLLSLARGKATEAVS